MDLGKMLLKMNSSTLLLGDDFRVFRQSAGFTSFPVDLSTCYHLAFTTVAMALIPTSHVVGYCEADHLQLSEVIESRKILEEPFVLPSGSRIWRRTSPYRRGARFVGDARVRRTASPSCTAFYWVVPVHARAGRNTVGPDPFTDPVTLSTAIDWSSRCPSPKGNASVRGGRHGNRGRSLRRDRSFYSEADTGGDKGEPRLRGIQLEAGGSNLRR